MNDSIDKNLNMKNLEDLDLKRGNLSDDYLFKKISNRKNELEKKYDDIIDLFPTINQ